MKIKYYLFTCMVVVFSTTLFGQKTITVEDIWKNYKFYHQGIPGFNTTPDGDYYTTMNRLAIEKFKFVNSEKTATLLNNADLKAMNSPFQIKDIQDYSFDNSVKKILVATQLESIYRRSSKAFYYVVDLEKKTVVAVADSSLGKQSFATFSPDGSKVAFVRGNNLFMKDLNSQTEIQITKDGLDRHIINGMADWVYEEELDMSQCFYWSPDGENIAFLRFDESRVKEFTLTYYGGLYPYEYRYKYPKAGEDNSLVNVLHTNNSVI